MEINFGDVLNAISILLVFIVGFFNYITTETRIKLNSPKPPVAQKKALKKYQKDLQRLFFYGIVLEIFILFVLLSLLGSISNILSNSFFTLVGNDPLNTLFCLIYICLIFIFLLLVRTIYMIIKCKNTKSEETAISSN